MVDKIVEILNKNKSSIKIEGDIISCIYTIGDVILLTELSDKGLIANSFIENYKINEDIVLEFLISKIRSQGFYMSKDSFLEWNRYDYPKKRVYIYKTNEFLINNTFFGKRYSTIIDLKDILCQNAKFSYKEDELLNLLIVREDKSLL